MTENYAVDFKKAKEVTCVRDLLSHYDLIDQCSIEHIGEEYKGWCPLGKRHGKKDSFSMNGEKKIFKCFACIKFVLEI